MMKLVYNKKKDRYDLWATSINEIKDFSTYLKLTSKIIYEDVDSIEELVEDAKLKFHPWDSVDLIREEELYILEFLQIKEEDDRIYSVRYGDNDSQQREPIFEEQQAGSCRPLGQAQRG